MWCTYKSIGIVSSNINSKAWILHSWVSDPLIRPQTPRTSGTTKISHFSFLFFALFFFFFFLQGVREEGPRHAIRRWSMQVPAGAREYYSFRMCNGKIDAYLK